MHALIRNIELIADWEGCFVLGFIFKLLGTFLKNIWGVCLSSSGAVQCHCSYERLNHILINMLPQIALSILVYFIKAVCFLLPSLLLSCFLNWMLDLLFKPSEPYMLDWTASKLNF